MNLILIFRYCLLINEMFNDIKITYVFCHFLEFQILDILYQPFHLRLATLSVIWSKHVGVHICVSVFSLVMTFFQRLRFYITSTITMTPISFLLTAWNFTSFTDLTIFVFAYSFQTLSTKK